MAAKASDKPGHSGLITSAGSMEWGGGGVRGQRFSSVNTADRVVYLASHNGCHYTPLQVQSTVPGWACENESRITLKGPTGLSFLKHCGYRLAPRNDYRSPGPYVGLLPPQHRSLLQPAGQAAEKKGEEGEEMEEGEERERAQ